MLLNKTDTSSSSDIPKVPLKKQGATIKSTASLFVTCQMMKINAFTTVGGIVLAIYSGFMVKMISNTIENKDEKLSKSLYCMMVLGVGEITGAFAIGKLIDITSNRVGVLCTLVSVILAFSSLVYTHSRNSYDAFWFLTALLFGLVDSFISTVGNSINGSEFMSDDGKKGVIEPFAIVKFLRSLVA